MSVASLFSFNLIKLVYGSNKIHAVNHHELWYRYMPESGNWHGGTRNRWMVALSAAALSIVFSGFMKVWAAKVYAKAEIENKAKHKIRLFVQTFKKTVSKREILDSARPVL